MEGADRQARGASDLGVRAASAIVMLTVAGAAVWLGGWFWAAFVIVISAGVFREWRGLVACFVRSPSGRGLWNAAGLVYLGVAAATLVFLRRDPLGTDVLMVMVLAVVATDIGAYFAGRTIGGPKIAPRISPSKTWAGLAGGAIGAACAIFFFALATADFVGETGQWLRIVPRCLLVGAACAIVAQAGDFFESWMKRRAGQKDSGAILPGHGGLFDRVDGLVAVTFLMGIYIALVHAMEPV